MLSFNYHDFLKIFALYIEVIFEGSFFPLKKISFCGYTHTPQTTKDLQKEDMKIYTIQM